MMINAMKLKTSPRMAQSTGPRPLPLAIREQTTARMMSMMAPTTGPVVPRPFPPRQDLGGRVHGGEMGSGEFTGDQHGRVLPPPPAAN